MNAAMERAYTAPDAWRGIFQVTGPVWGQSPLPGFYGLTRFWPSGIRWPVGDAMVCAALMVVRHDLRIYID